MYFTMAQKANNLLLKYNITDFPINTEMIDCIIENEGLKIEFTDSIKNAVIIDNAIYMNKPDNMRDYRSFIVHEYGHYTYQCGNIEYLPNKNKYEMEAQAFAAYFLMPIGIFEKHLELEENDYELSQDFGVTLELVKFRKNLTKALIDSGEYNLLVYSLYFRKGNTKDNIIDNDNIYFHLDNLYKKDQEVWEGYRTEAKLKEDMPTRQKQTS